MKTFRQIRMANIVRLFLVVSVALLVLLGLPGCGQTYSLSTSVSPSGSGSVSPSSGTYDTGKNVTLIATPASGYQFVSWSGDASGTNAITTVTMNSSKHVVANFAQQQTYRLSTLVSPFGSGTVTLSSPGGTYVSGTNVTLVATAAYGYRFGWWSGDASGTNPVVTITMNSDKYVTANFASSIYFLLL
jgi:xyloglucan-specific exo-beta-1,4-glucanase